MRLRTKFYIFLYILMLPYAAMASLIEENYDGEEPRVTTPWFEYYTEENYKTDQAYITGMHPHHAGGLSMSKEYLASDGKLNESLQDLARGIIKNQTFEMSMLDTVEKNINAIDFSGGAAWYKVAERGLAQKNRFIRAPMPAVQKSFHDADPVSDEDVRFAKAMIVHHEGALMMAKHYLQNLNGENGYLELLNLDILRDQAQEIQLMMHIVAFYAGNPDNIKITPSMIHGMDGMMHNMDMNEMKHDNDHRHAH